MKIMEPFIPVRVESENAEHKIELLNRCYTIGADGMISSIVSSGKELLASPMRIVLQEDGESAVFDIDYQNNESESFIQRRNDREAIICGSKQSERFIIDFCNTIRYDGSIDIDLKLATRGKTVAQTFGIAGVKPLAYRLDNLWLEVPLKKEFCTFYHIFCDLARKEVPPFPTTAHLTEKGLSIPFKPFVWLGDDDIGLGFFTESRKYWQFSNEQRAFEVVFEGDTAILRIRLLDSHPISWGENYENGMDCFAPLDFHFGFMPTPVKQFPDNPYIHKALHLDCGIKIKGNYIDFMTAERFNRLVEKGVDTLILHEKWNKSQNYYELSEFTAWQLKYISTECHKRGIKLLVYFGFELSSMSPEWSSLKDKVLYKDENGKIQGGWWRVPFQRDYMVCYNSEYADSFIGAILDIIDTYHLDGVYLDSTASPRLCSNREHGCGWYDENGKLQGAYTVNAVRRLFEKLSTEIKKRGGIISLHNYGFINFTVLPFVDQTWYGENLQQELMLGSEKDVDIDYFRAEYCGRNMGVPVEFLAYENRPYWTFEKALSCSILHGILPRPNNIEYPLDLMSEVWKIIEGYPISKAEWCPYYKNGANTSNEKIKVSYYKHTSLDGAVQLLAFVTNISSKEISAEISFNENVSTAYDCILRSPTTLNFTFEPYGYKIIFLK